MRTQKIPGNTYRVYFVYSEVDEHASNHEGSLKGSFFTYSGMQGFIAYLSLIAAPWDRFKVVGRYEAVEDVEFESIEKLLVRYSAQLFLKTAWKAGAERYGR